MKIINRIRNYITGSLDELKRVIWPTRKQAIFLTIVVLGFSVAMAAYLAVFDLVFRNGLEKLLKV